MRNEQAKRPHAAKTVRVRTSRTMDRDLLAMHLRRADREAGALLERVRPGGAGDATVPAAREWLRRWAPKRVTLQPTACSCAAGRCAACN
jgi:hypothetical protein